MDYDMLYHLNCYHFLPPFIIGVEVFLISTFMDIYCIGRAKNEKQ